MTWSVLAPAMLALGACTANPPQVQQSRRQPACFWPSQVSGFSEAGPDRALVNLGLRETWELTLSPGCPDVNWALNIGFEPRGGGRVCVGEPVQLLVPNASGSGSQRCLVRNVRLLSPDEAAAARGLTRAP